MTNPVLLKPVPDSKRVAWATSGKGTSTRFEHVDNAEEKR